MYVYFIMFLINRKIDNNKLFMTMLSVVRNQDSEPGAAASRRGPHLRQAQLSHAQVELAFFG